MNRFGDTWLESCIIQLLAKHVDLLVAIFQRLDHSIVNACDGMRVELKPIVLPQNHGGAVEAQDEVTTVFDKIRVEVLAFVCKNIPPYAGSVDAPLGSLALAIKYKRSVTACVEFVGQLQQQCWRELKFCRILV